MKITVSQEVLLSRLGIATRAASPRSAVQSLGGVLLEASGGSVELRATDMELGIRVALDARAEGDGTVVLPARLLLDVIRSLPAGDVTIEQRVGRDDVEVLSGSSRFELRLLPADEFPRLPEPGDAATVSVPTAAFVETVERVARSASRDETRPHLTGVLVSASGTELRMVATDSYRLSVKETKLESALDGELEANVPARTLQELARIAGSEGAETIATTALENQVIFTCGDIVLSSRLVEGRFPNYRQLLPETYEHELRVSRREILDVVRRIGLLAQKNVPLRMAFSDGQLEVSAQTPDVGQASETIPVPFKGELLEIGFNPEFIRDGLESAETDELVLKLISPLRPGLIESGDDGGFVYLVMPIRLNT
jgi:DNA polymerase-3 subunit beta